MNWLCHLGFHTQTFSDNSACYGALRCDRCNVWIDPIEGAYIDNCRALMTLNQHPNRRCFLSDKQEPLHDEDCEAEFNNEWSCRCAEKSQPVDDVVDNAGSQGQS